MNQPRRKKTQRLAAFFRPFRLRFRKNKTRTIYRRPATRTYKYIRVASVIMANALPLSAWLDNLGTWPVSNRFPTTRPTQNPTKRPNNRVRERQAPYRDSHKYKSICILRGWSSCRLRKKTNRFFAKYREIEEQKKTTIKTRIPYIVRVDTQILYQVKMNHFKITVTKSIVNGIRRDYLSLFGCYLRAPSGNNVIHILSSFSSVYYLSRTRFALEHTIIVVHHSELINTYLLNV